MLRLVQAFSQRPGEPASSLTIAREFADPHLELIRLLHEACEIEHSLLVQYLYSAFSVKDIYKDIAGTLDAGSNSLVGVAIQEMHHLTLVNRMLVSLGGSPNLNRQDFPYEPQIYPFEMELEQLTLASLAKYIYAEAPSDSLRQGPFHSAEDNEFAERVLRLLPNEARLNHIGTLYNCILAIASELPAAQRPSTFEQMLANLHQIKTQGEMDHFIFFKRLFQRSEIWKDPHSDIYPSHAVARNPTALPGRLGAISDQMYLAKARLGNLHYWIVLALLNRAFREDPDSQRCARHILLANQHMIGALYPLGKELSGVGSGLPFDPLDIGYYQKEDQGSGFILDLLGEALTCANDLMKADAISGGRSVEVIRDSIADLKSPPGKRVAVVGSGPAGLSAAVALSNQGYSVELFERSNLVGGKVHSFRDNQEHSIEHGVHGWWMNYLNFNRILKLAGVDLADSLKEAEGSNLAIQSSIYRLKNFRFNIPSPLFLLLQSIRAPYLTIRDALSLIPFGLHLLAFRHESEYRLYDELSFQELMDRLKVSDRVQKLILRPFILSFDFTTPDRVSASCGLSGMQFYVLPNQKSILTRWSRGLPAEKIFAPIVRFFQSRGGILHLDSGVSALQVIKAGLQLTVLPLSVNSNSEVARIPVDGIPEKEFVAIDTKAGPAWIRRNENAFIALSGLCTHQSCPVEWKSDVKRFQCPCHGGSYDSMGKRLSGPPVGPLSSMEVTLEGASVVLHSVYKQKYPRFDAVVIAADLEATKSILGASPDAPKQLLKDLSNLDTTPVVVVRIWFPERAQIPAFLESALTPESNFVDNFFHLNRFDSSYDLEGQVVEVQSYRVNRWIDASDDDILKVAFEDIQAFCPELSSSIMVSYHINRHRSLFTRYAPGFAKSRPAATSGIANVYLAGDWTDADWSVWMMERAVVSGLRAANCVLINNHDRPFGIERLPKEGLILRISRSIAKVLRGLFWSGHPPGSIGA